MKKRYSLEYYGSSEMIVEVDDERLTPELLKDWNEFWSDHENRATHPGGPLIPLLKMTYLVALRRSVTDWDGVESLRDGREEGFPKMDGSQGITIVSYDEFEFDEFEIDVRKVSQPSAPR